jgi:D-xylose reductase
VTRADLFVTSKLWNTDHEPARVEEACRRTLADLGLEYLDLYLVHFPLAMAYSPPAEGEGGARFLDAAPTATPPPAVGLQDTWRAMEALVAKGLVRSIGVSNYSAALLVDLVRYAKVQPAVNQVEIHPYLAQPRLVAWCQAHNIHVTAYSSLGSISYAKFDHFDFKGPFLLEHPAVAEIAAEHGKTAAQVLLRWAVQRGIAVIPKSTNAGRIAENADVVDWALSDSAMATLNGLDANRRFNNMVDLFWDAPIWS